MSSQGRGSTEPELPRPPDLTTEELVDLLRRASGLCREHNVYDCLSPGCVVEDVHSL